MARSDDSGSVTEPASSGKKYALVVGVNEAAKEHHLTPLKYAETDAQRIHLHLQLCNFAVSPQSYLVGGGATTQKVQAAAASLISHSTTEDLLLFYFIGHGYPILTTSGDVEIYLVTSDFDPNTAKFVPAAHLSLSWIRNTFLANGTIGNIIVVLDCCYSGKALDSGSQTDQILYSMRPGQAHTQYDRMWTIITSTGADKAAYEDASGHTRMTGLILRALEGKDQTALDNRDLTIFSLYNYLQQRMEERQPVQSPRMWGYFPRRWVLANHPADNPIITKLEELKPVSQQFFDETICQTTTFEGDLDTEQVRTFLQQDRVLLQDDYRAGLSEQEQMKELGLLQGGRPSYAVLLCLGRHPSHQITGAYTQCICWRDTERHGDKDLEEYQGSLLQQFIRGCDFLKKKLGEQVSYKNDEPERNKLPYRALQEALANALVHREYVTEPDRRSRAEKVQVEIFSNRVEISSPGGLPPTVSLESLQEADKQRPGSHPRNPQIMRIFYLAGCVENVGTGVARIQRWMQEANLPKPRIELHQQTLTVVLTRPGEPSIVEPSVPPMLEEAKTLLSEESKEAFPAEVQVEPVSMGGSKLEEVGVPKLPPKKSSWFPQPRYFISGVVLSTILISGLVLSTPYLTSLFHGPILPPASTTIEIASDFPTSGLDTTSGLPQQNGVQMAIDEANNNQVLAGYTLKLVQYNDVGRDNRHDPQVGANNLKQAITDNLVAGIIGPYNSDVANTELPVTNQAPIVLISPSTTYPCLTKSPTDDPDCTGSDNIQAQMRPTGQRTFFRLATPDDLESKAAADYLFKKGYHKVV